MCLQFDPSHDAIPVPLCLVGYTMRVLSHTDILDAIIYFNRNLIFLANIQKLGHIINMGCI